MPQIRNLTYAICPVDDCTVAFEAESGEEYFCPTCRMEMVTACPACGTRIAQEDQITCGQCDKDLKQ